MKTLSKTSNKYSNLKIAWFPQKLESLRDCTVTAPIYVRVKPTNRCNHNCFFCVYNASFSNMHDTMSRKDELSKEKLIEILNDFSKIGVKAVTYSGGGEPLMHPNIVEILIITKQYGIDLSIITNGQLLSAERAQELVNAK
jgi:molybdenum cofactor biosynthesis enzyme MoaA